MLKTLVKKCDVSRKYMTSGFVYEHLKSKKSSCSIDCVEKDIEKRKKIKRATIHKKLYYKNWKDIVYVVFDNQYVSLEDAKFIVDNFGQPNTNIKERIYDPSQPLYKIVNGIQVQI